MSHTRKHIASALKAGQPVTCLASGVSASPCKLGFRVTRQGSDWAHVYARATDAANCMVEMMRRGNGF